LGKLITKRRELVALTSRYVSPMVERASNTSRLVKACFLSTAIVPVLFAFHGGSIVQSPTTAPPPVASANVSASSANAATIPSSGLVSTMSSVDSPILGMSVDSQILSVTDDHAIGGDTLAGVASPLLRFAIISPDPAQVSARQEVPIAEGGATADSKQAAEKNESLAVVAAADTHRPAPSSRASRESLHPFIASAIEPAQRSQLATGVPASVTIAQAILESDWGKSGLAVRGQNYFGIKATKGPGPAGVITMNTWEVMNGKNVTVSAGFRKYNNMEESFTDHGNFLANGPRYAKAMAVKDDARAFARAIHAAGYATDPAYSTKLINIMQKYELFEFDLSPE
jgi:flagellum-specific peptidoglycan hydrolase FlgJ